MILDGDGDAKDRTVTYMAHEDFMMSDAPKNWDTTLDVDETAMITAKAATQSGDAIPGVEFGWASKNEDAVTVDGGMIEAVGTGSSEITVTAMGRGIAVKFTVEVLSEVKSIVITSPDTGHYLSNGESVALVATARDKAQDDDEAGIEGDNVNVTVTFMSDNTDVIEIDGSDANAVGVGSAKITAHYADVKSKAITINVTPGGDVTHLITFTRNSAADRAFHIVATHSFDSTADPVDTTSTYVVNGPGDDRDDATESGADVTFTVQIKRYDSEGNAALDSGAAAASIDIDVQQSGMVLDEAGISAVAAGGGQPAVFSL